MVHPFRVLGVSPNRNIDPDDRITRKYRALQLQYAPDIVARKGKFQESGPAMHWANAHAAEVNEARDILLDPNKRRQCERDEFGNRGDFVRDITFKEIEGMVLNSQLRSKLFACLYDGRYDLFLEIRIRSAHVDILYAHLECMSPQLLRALYERQIASDAKGNSISRVKIYQAIDVPMLLRAFELTGPEGHKYLEEFRAFEINEQIRQMDPFFRVAMDQRFPQPLRERAQKILETYDQWR